MIQNLLLDEPFSALDILSIKMIQEIILNLQSTEEITIVVTDHQARDLLKTVDRNHIVLWQNYRFRKSK